MDTLPEELIAQIFSNIHDSSDALHPHPNTSTLHAICLTSRKLARIGTPYLYHSIHSKSGPMGFALLRVLSDDKTGSLRRHVRDLAVQHTTQGCFQVSNKYTFEDEHYGYTYDQCPITLARTMRWLPQLETLDLSRLPLADEGTNSWLSTLSGKCRMNRAKWWRNTGFEHVSRMALHLGPMGVEEIWVVFRLPKLRELEVDVRTPQRGIVWQRRVDLFKEWKTSTSNLETLRLVGLSFGCGRLDTIPFMSRACVALKSLSVSTGDIMVLQKIPLMFHAHVCRGVLTRVQIAVVGLWHYDVDLVAIEKECDLPSLGTELGTLMMYATGSYDESRKEVFESEHLRIVRMREQNEGEKRSYDPRRPRRP